MIGLTGNVVVPRIVIEHRPRKDALIVNGRSVIATARQLDRVQPRIAARIGDPSAGVGTGQPVRWIAVPKPCSGGLRRSNANSLGSVAKCKPFVDSSPKVLHGVAEDNHFHLWRTMGRDVDSVLRAVTTIFDRRYADLARRGLGPR